MQFNKIYSHRILEMEKRVLDTTNLNVDLSNDNNSSQNPSVKKGTIGNKADPLSKKFNKKRINIQLI